MVDSGDEDAERSPNATEDTFSWACAQYKKVKPVELSCNASFDGVSCWPPSKAGTVVIIPCFPEFNKIKYDVNDNASRICHLNGTWDKNSNYTNCKVIRHYHDIPMDDWDVTDHTMVIYFVGYTLSLIALLIALGIFISFKRLLVSRDLRCLRNIFHANLMLTYVLVNCTWIIMATCRNALTNSQSGPCVLVIFLYYFQGTNFFWMFVEGFHLYLLVTKTFEVDVKFYVYMLIGWGTPAIVVAIWVVVKSEFVQVEEHQILSLGPVSLGCPWIDAHHYDFIFICPILLVLFVNVVFLFRIVQCIITKIREPATAESKQHSKAAKALVVLTPLLGGTYILVIAAPTTGVWGALFAYTRSVLLSTQGLTVSVLYCFLNGEVQKAIRKQWNRWREDRYLRCSSRHSMRNFRESSKTQGARIDSSGFSRCDRDNVSFVTSTTYVGNGCSTGNETSMSRWDRRESSLTDVREVTAV